MTRMPAPPRAPSRGGRARRPACGRRPRLHLRSRRFPLRRCPRRCSPGRAPDSICNPAGLPPIGAPVLLQGGAAALELFDELRVHREALGRAQQLRHRARAGARRPRRSALRGRGSGRAGIRRCRSPPSRAPRLRRSSPSGAGAEVVRLSHTPWASWSTCSLLTTPSAIRRSAHSSATRFGGP